MLTTDSRRPNPPIGYACECTLTLEQQIDLVAEFHVRRTFAPATAHTAYIVVF